MTKLRLRGMILPACWLFVLATGFAAIFHYEQIAGTAGTSQKSWPSESVIQPDPNRNTLIFFAHPRCPCTRASVEELNRLLAHCSDKVTTHAFFVKPSDESPGWSQSSLWRSVARIPGVQVHEDVDGKEAKLFGSETSGYIVLYSSDGRLLFSGGITAARGHVGDNTNEEALLALISNRKSSINRTPVYGCSLFNCTTTDDKAE